MIPIALSAHVSVAAAASSPLAELGFRAGTSTATEALGRLPAGAIVRVTVVRDGQVVEVSGAKP